MSAVATPQPSTSEEAPSEAEAQSEPQPQVEVEVEVEPTAEGEPEARDKAGDPAEGEPEAKGEAEDPAEGGREGGREAEEAADKEAEEEEGEEEDGDPAEGSAPPDSRHLRQPIVAVLGHVDHGKTSLLDFIRGTGVVAKEAGAITQHIGATEVPMALVREICGPLLDQVEVRLPGLLFIDTPGHHSFTTLRARGGALADLAILVVDIYEGLMPQTLESLKILRQAKTPFVVALNKVDRISGWKSRPGSHAANARRQSQRALDNFEQKFYKLVGQLAAEGFSGALYTKVTDFTRTLALVPVSAKKTGEGLPDLLMVLMGVAQRYLRNRLYLTPGPAEGTVLEVTEDRGLGKTLSVILYNGLLSVSDTIVVGAIPDPIVSRVKTILRPRPWDRTRDKREAFTAVKEVGAAAGVKLVAPHLEGVLSGAPFYCVPPGQDIADTLVKLAEQMEPNVTLDEEGVVIKADAVGSLEALAYELHAADIPIMAAGVGDVSHRDLVTASTAPALRKVVLAFNVKLLPSARKHLEETGVQLFQSQVVYQLLDDYQEWYAREKEARDSSLRGALDHPGKFLLLEDHVFRQKDPAVVGVRVLAGRLVVGQKVLKSDGRVVGRIRSMRSGEHPLKEAQQGDEVAVAITKVIVGRHIHENDVLFIDLKEGDARQLASGILELTHDEEEALREIIKIKRKTERPFWGR